MLAGEVPVRVLAAEATAGLGWRPVPAAGVAEMSVAELAAQPSPADGVEPEAEPAEAPGRRRPISWRPPPRTRTAPARAATSDSEAAPGSVPDEPDEADVEALGARRDAPVAPRRRPKKWIWVSAGAAGLLALAGAGTALLVSAPGKPAATPVRPAPTAAIDTRVGPTVTVTKVLSPDTVEVTGGYSGTVSVLGILVPSADKAQCGATTAKSYASRRLTDARVTLITDPTQPPVDSSGNRLAFLRLKDGSDYSLDAVKAGMARSFDGQPPVQSAAALKAAEADAKRRGVGLWAAPCHGKFGSSPTSTGDTSASPTSSTSAGPTATATSGTGAATRSAGNPN
jgi:micrococcal nuclease